ncbi:hypothetical protein WJU17_07000 [Iodidimonas sp. SYSU 1G8]
MLGIQGMGDDTRALAGRELAEDAADDLGLALIDAPLAGCSGDKVVAIGVTCGDAALEDQTQLAPLGLLLQIRQIDLRHGAEEADMQMGNLAGRDGVERDAVELELVEQGRHVRELAADAVNGLGENDIEGSAPKLRAQRLEGGAGRGSAAEGPVLEGPDNGPAAGLGIAAAEFDLILDRGILLVVGGIAGVDDGAQTHSGSL